MAPRRPRSDQRIGELQARQQRDEFRIGLRALLMQPLMTPTHEDFPAVRRQAEPLRNWFATNAPLTRRALSDTGIVASWDAALVLTMQRHGLAIAEEAVAAVLLEDLGQNCL